MMQNDKITGSEGLSKSRTIGKFRCHNPSCMGRFQPDPGIMRIKCPDCGMEFRVSWIRPDLPRIRGPVWDANKKLVKDLRKTEGK